MLLTSWAWTSLPISILQAVFVPHTEKALCGHKEFWSLRSFLVKKKKNIKWEKSKNENNYKVAAEGPQLTGTPSTCWGSSLSSAVAFGARHRLQIMFASLLDLGKFPPELFTLNLTFKQNYAHCIGSTSTASNFRWYCLHIFNTFLFSQNSKGCS